MLWRATSGAGRQLAGLGQDRAHLASPRGVHVMSLMQRVERAQKAAQEAAERAKRKTEEAQEAHQAAQAGAEAPARSEGAAPSAVTTASVPAVQSAAAATPATQAPGGERPLVPVGPAPTGRPLTDARTAAGSSAPQMQAPRRSRADLIRELRQRLQGEVVNACDTLLDIKTTDVRTKIEAIVDRVVAAHGFAVTRDERANLVEAMVHDVTGFGPLEPLLQDETITEVMVNGPNH